jgi:hypothetical protein
MSLDKPSQRKRLQYVFQCAIRQASEAENRLAQASIKIAKDKTQYFEKIALANAATIALIVSFVGAHAGRLQPPSMLRAALIVIVVAMILAMLRNLLNPHYVIADYTEQKLIAELDRERRRLDFYNTGLESALWTGGPVNIDNIKAHVQERERILEPEIKGAEKTKTLFSTLVSIVEWFALLLTLAGMLLLIVLAWINFSNVPTN